MKKNDVVTVNATGYFVATTDGTHIGPGDSTEFRQEDIDLLSGSLTVEVWVKAP